jgi:hypothetical protein
MVALEEPPTKGAVRFESEGWKTSFLTIQRSTIRRGGLGAFGMACASRRNRAKQKPPRGAWRFKTENTRESGDPTGIRTRVTAVKGRCPRPLDDRVG